MEFEGPFFTNGDGNCFFTSWLLFDLKFLRNPFRTEVHRLRISVCKYIRKYFSKKENVWLNPPYATVEDYITYMSEDGIPADALILHFTACVKRTPLVIHNAMSIGGTFRRIYFPMSDDDRFVCEYNEPRHIAWVSFSGNLESLVKSNGSPNHYVPFRSRRN